MRRRFKLAGCRGYATMRYGHSGECKHLTVSVLDTWYGYCEIARFRSEDARPQGLTCEAKLEHTRFAAEQRAVELEREHGTDAAPAPAQ